MSPSEIPPPGEHGGDGAAIAAALGVAPDAVLDLSASLNPFAPDVAGLAAHHLDALSRYPDVDAAEALLADGLDLPRDRVVLTAGGAQAIALVADHLGAGRVDEPEFSLYRRHLPRLDAEALPWRSDPHNPTGLLVPHQATFAPSTASQGRRSQGPTPQEGRPLSMAEDAASGVPGRRGGSPMLPDEALTSTDEEGVWDEAFLAVSAGVWTRERPGWTLGSLTKAFACPGLRLGYVVAPDPDAAAALRDRRPAWAVGGLACALLPGLLDRADPPWWTRRIAAARGELTNLLDRHGFTPLPSDAPWVLVPAARGLRDRLARHAVVVRDCASFGLVDHVRIAVPNDSGLERLEDALTKGCA